MGLAGHYLSSYEITVEAAKARGHILVYKHSRSLQEAVLSQV